MRLIIILATLLLSTSAMAQTLTELTDAHHRSAEEKARDNHRHPVDTLAFFDVEADMTVVEIWPGGGWYTALLAPLLRQSGTYYAAHFPQDSDVPFYRRSVTLFKAKLAERPDIYDHVRVTALNPPHHSVIAPAGTADRVLTFRNVHNWAKAGKTDAFFASFYEALKPGGILGVVEHRAAKGSTFEHQIKTGYMTEAYVIERAEKAGFQLVASAEINANPKDSSDHPAGVWTLPPSLRLGDKDREKYQAIGESDRMTLKFIKPME